MNIGMFLRASQGLDSYLKGNDGDIYKIPEGKVSNSQWREYLARMLPWVCKNQNKYLLVTDASLFKVLTKHPTPTKAYGYILKCIEPGYEQFKAVYAPGPTQVIYDPKNAEKVDLAFKIIGSHENGTYSEPGNSVIHNARYLTRSNDVKAELAALIATDLTVDIETFSLRPETAGLGSICFCWNQHEGIAFPIDLGRNSAPFREILKDFFLTHKGKLIFHNASFDVSVLIRQLYMKDGGDNAGLLKGLHAFRNLEDTKIIKYLAVNSCGKNQLDLKSSSQEYLGDYAEDVKDIKSLPVGRLLEYNLKDGLATWYVYNKYYPLMVSENQDDLYRDLFRPILFDIIQMQLTGLPVDMALVEDGKHDLELIRDKALQDIAASAHVKTTEMYLNEAWAEKKNKVLKKKRVTADDGKEVFNPGSPHHLATLLHQVLLLPVLSRTTTGLPETGKKALKALKGTTSDSDVLELLQAIMDWKDVEKILGTFIPAFENAVPIDGWHYLQGNFNLGGTVSGRLSSSGPNLQNLPATGATYAKAVKKMFRAPPGWLFIGLDFDSLEDRISALTTKDPAKLAVYTQGLDGHSYRAFSYFRDEMPDIRQAESGTLAYQAKVGDTDIHFLETDTIEYEGKKYTGLRFHELFTSGGL